MTATAGIAQWLAVPGQPATNERTATQAVHELAGRGCDVVIAPGDTLANGQWWIMANQHGNDLLGGSQIIAPDGSIAAAAPRGEATPGCQYLVHQVELAAHECGPLLAGRRPDLYSRITGGGNSP
jgi:predicted amidohydrolase